MSSCTYRLLLASALLVVAQFVQESKGSHFPETFESLTGNDLCHFDEARITRVSTVKRLLEAFEASDAACRDDWLKPLSNLQQLLDLSAIDACSMDTIKALEHYHWYYVVGTLSKSWRKASDASIPEPLRLFFIHFAKETLEQCKSSVVSRLREAISSSQVQPMSLSHGWVGITLKTLSIAMVPEPKIKNYDHFFFIYDAIINSERKKGYLIEETVPNPVTGEVKYFDVKLHDASRTQELQQKCKQDLRPIYLNTVLPIMKLIDLGFGTSGQRIKHEEKLLAQWYEIAQFCEFMLPVKFYSSRDLKNGQVALVEDDDEIKLLESSQEKAPDATSSSAQHVELTRVQLGDVIAEAENDDVAKQVRTSFKSRTRVYRKALKNSLASIKYELTSRVKRFFVSKKSSGQFVAADGSEELSQSLAEAEKEVVEDELEERVQDGNSLARHKRENIYEEQARKSKSMKKKSRWIALFIVACLFVFIVLLCTGTIHIG